METVKSIRPCSHIRLDFYDDGNYALVFPKRYWSKDIFLFNAQDMLIKFTQEGMQGYKLFKNSNSCLDLLRSNIEINCKGECNHPLFIKTLYSGKEISSIH